MEPMLSALQVWILNHWIAGEIPLPNSFIEVLTPNVAIFEKGASEKLIKVKWAYKGGILM